MKRSVDAQDGPVGVVAAGGTMVDLVAAFQGAGVRVVRFDALRFVPSISPARKRSLQRAVWDGIVLSSPRGADLALAPVFGPARKEGASPVVYTAGESTAVGARRLGYRVVLPNGPLGMVGIAAAVPADRPLRLLHPRSDIAGPRLAMLLRARGHTVRDVVAFRTVPASRMPADVRRGLLQSRLLIVWCPSALRSLRTHLGKDAFRELARAVPFRALGETTAKAVRRAGVRDVGLLDAGPGQAFTPATVTLLLDGRRAVR
ncbi:MAG: uroporphyrinogen-III synthase [Thermoplasmata archaeon]|nr:uroporphyrinogen-III synthase [Thermoplasmata archaeon]